MIGTGESIRSSLDLLIIGTKGKPHFSGLIMLSKKTLCEPLIHCEESKVAISRVDDECLLHQDHAEHVDQRVHSQ